MNDYQQSPENQEEDAAYKQLYARQKSHEIQSINNSW